MVFKTLWCLKWNQNVTLNLTPFSNFTYFIQHKWHLERSELWIYYHNSFHQCLYCSVTLSEHVSRAWLIISGNANTINQATVVRVLVSLQVPALVTISVFYIHAASSAAGFLKLMTSFTTFMPVTQLHMSLWSPSYSSHFVPLVCFFYFVVNISEKHGRIQLVPSRSQLFFINKL